MTKVHVVVWLSRHACMTSMVGPGYIIYGWAGALSTTLGIVCLISFAHV